MNETIDQPTKLPKVHSRSRQQRSDSQGGINNKNELDSIDNNGYQNPYSHRSISYHHHSRPMIYNQSNYDPTSYREFKKERSERQKAEKEAVMLKNRIILLQKQQESEQRKLEGSKMKAHNLYQMKKKIQQDKDDIELKRLEEMENMEKQTLLLKEKKYLQNQQLQDQKLKHQQMKQLEVFRLKQQALLDKKRREQLNLLNVAQNRAKRDERLQYEKHQTQNKQLSQQRDNEERIQYKIQTERLRNQDINSIMNQLENMEMSLINDLKKTRTAQRNVIDKVKYAQHLPFDDIKQIFPDINKKANQQYEEIFKLEDYKSPYSKEVLISNPAPNVKSENPLNEYDRMINKYDNINKNQKATSLYTEDFIKKQENEKQNQEQELKKEEVQTQEQDQSTIKDKKDNHEEEIKVEAENY